VAVPDALVRDLADWLGSRAAVNAKRLPVRLVRALRDTGLRESAVRTAGRIGLGLPLPGRTRNGAPTRYDGMPTTRSVAADEPLERARYIVAAAARLSKAAEDGQLAKALKLEQAYAQMHLLTGRKRRAGAALLDAAAKRTRAGLLVWRTVMDSRTTPDCAALNGRIFHITDPPGIPGAMHLRCRCSVEPWH
jgi:SPP1 gp7 family putative phage head morphogenesis protein